MLEGESGGGGGGGCLFFPSPCHGDGSGGIGELGGSGGGM